MTTLDTSPQAVDRTLTRHALFLVLTINDSADALQSVRDLCGDLAGLVRTVSTRGPEADLSCVTGFASTAWDRLFGAPRPASLHPFREFEAGSRKAPATPGDVLLHIRAEQMDQCFEFATIVMDRLRDAVQVVDEVHGFRYFDRRALIGFVDGTENPRGRDVPRYTLVGDEDEAFRNGSYVLVQKYLHDMTGWNALSTEQQELIIGRHKSNNVELDDEIKPSRSHSTLTTLEVDGEEVKILRDNMPFGRPGAGEFGTFFIGYARTPAPIEQMLENMVIGVPPGNYDRLLDFSNAVTGGLFFAPSEELLEALAERTPAV